MALPLAAIGFGLDALGGLGKAGFGLFQLIKGARMNPQRPVYNIPPEIKSMLGLSQTNLNARAAGAAQAERNINRAQANAVGAASRGATSSAQLLSFAAGAQGNTNNALIGLQANEAIDRQRRLSNLQNAQRVMAT